MVKRKNPIEVKENKYNIMKTTELRNLIKETIKEMSEDAAMKKSALGMAMYGKKSKMERARYKDGGPPIQAQAGEVNVFG